MSDAPEVTITDPRDDRGPSDLLDGGGEHLGLSRRMQAGLLAVVLIAGASVLAGRAIAQDRAQTREREAAFAEADALHTTAALGNVFSTEIGSGRVTVEVNLGSDGSGERDQLTGLVLDGPFLSALPEQPYPFIAGQQTQTANATVDCSALAAGRIPDRADVTLTLVPRSTVPHLLRLPIAAAQIREVALAACDLPDPDRPPVAEVSGTAGRLQLYVETAPRKKGVRLESVSLAGFALGLRGQSLPMALEINVGYFFDLAARVVDCRVAQGSDLQVRATFAEAGERRTVDAQPSVTQPQPGSVPAQEVLGELLAAACS